MSMFNVVIQLGAILAVVVIYFHKLNPFSNTKTQKQKMLTLQLRELEAAGLLTRTVYPVIPPHVEYSLTERGMELAPVLRGLCAWSGKYAVEKGITLAPLPPSRDGKDLPGAAESFPEA